MSDDESDEVLRKYASHIAKFAARAAGPIRDMALADPHLVLDDGLIRELVVDESQKEVDITLVQGDLQVGYRLLHLSLRDGLLTQPVTEVAPIVSDPASEIWYWELDERTGAAPPYSLRLLMFPKGEISVDFSEMVATWAPMQSRGQRSAGIFVQK
jgi:hypothetical protein